MVSKRGKLKPTVRAIVDWAAVHGWVLQDAKDGSGHWVLRHPEHGTYRLPDTPGEYRGLENARADLRRLSGLPSDSGPAAKYRHESRTERFDMEATLRERRLREAKAEAEALARRRETEAAQERVDLLTTRLDAAYAELESIDPRRSQDRARELAALIVDLREQLNRA